MRSVRGLLALAAAAAASCASEPPTESTPEKETTATARQGVTGNIEPGEIQIDTSADLYANVGVPLNTGALLDWVLGTTGNTGTGCLDPDTSIASCVEPGVTGAVGGAGTWNGIRIVDGIGGADGNIFVRGGKENDVSTWNIEPGNVGGAKFDLTQAYLANNQDNLYFGMERSGNNGTTAFDFEFNQKAPMSTGCIQNPLIPCRTVNDVLFTFEMQGSGGSGSAVPHIFLWSGTTYVEQSPLPAGVFTSINTLTTTDAAPWGRVDAQGNWVLTDFGRFQLAEATAPMELLTGAESQCGGTAYVQVRTRSSATASSDLKDTSKIFEFQFNNLSATATITSTCGAVAFEAAAKDPSGVDIPLEDLTCEWVFVTNEDSETPGEITKSGCEGSFTEAELAGVDTVSGTVTVTSTSTGSCTGGDEAAEVSVFSPITVSLAPDSAGATCESEPSVEDTLGVVTYTASAQGGEGTLTYDWTIDACDGQETCEVGGDADMCHVEALSVTVDDASESCPPVTSEEETYTKITIVTATDNTGGGDGGGGGTGSGGNGAVGGAGPN